MIDIAARIVAEARSWVGTPYHHQAALKGVGCDCLGLVRGVYANVYGSEPELPPAYSRDWAETQARETLAEGAGRHLMAIPIGIASPGDVLLFALNDQSPAKHCSIMTTPDRMVHAIESHAVTEVHLVPWWRVRIRFAFRFPEPA
jgi:NlpC/P60 family putative phage cell wall peptidase